MRSGHLTKHSSWSKWQSVADDAPPSRARITSVICETRSSMFGSLGIFFSYANAFSREPANYISEARFLIPILNRSRPGSGAALHFFEKSVWNFEIAQSRHEIDVRFVAAVIVAA